MDEFLAEIASIMAETEFPLVAVAVSTLRGTPASHGWVRASAFDRDGLRAWERPDGSIVGLAGAAGLSRPPLRRPLAA